MGCMSSKIMRRSSSFQEELSLSLQRRTNGVPGLEDLLVKKNSGGDQLLALLCTANTVAAKLRAGGAGREQGKPCARPSELEHGEKPTAASDEPASPETIDAWELMADLKEEEEEEEEEGQEQEQERRQRLLQHSQELTYSSGLGKTHSCGVAEGNGTAAVAGGCVPRSRSFRTVEDFDAMVEGNSSLLVCEPPSNTSGRATPMEERTGDEDADGAPDRTDGLERNDIKVKPELPETDPTAWSRNSSAREPAAGNRRSSVEPRGLRRRAMAKELQTLNVPSFEFSSVGSLREWLGGGGQVFSPGSYVTPKFGSFVSPAGGAAPRCSGDAGREEALFDPQLVADLEDAMERLTLEEEHILSQIVESLQGSHEEDAEGGEVGRQA